ncbi:MAG: S9 family peptidase [Bacteroidetes bacterium]|nr:S9 family peptidase [Bacteroidota bacterium]
MKVDLLLPITAMVFCLQIAYGQKPLTINDFNAWKELQDMAISTGGKHLCYLEKPLVGNAHIVMHNLTAGTNDTFENAAGPAYTFNGKFLAVTRVADYEQIRSLKLKKEKKELFPPDSLFLIKTSTFDYQFIDLVKSWKLPETNSQWMAYAKADMLPNKGDVKEEETEPKAKPLAKPKKLDGCFTLVLYNIQTQEKEEFSNVKTYGFSSNGRILFYHTLGDSGQSEGVYVYRPNDGRPTRMEADGKSFASITCDTAGRHIAFMYGPKRPNAQVNPYRFFLYDLDKSEVVADLDANIMDPGWTMNHLGKLYFSEKGHRCFFGLSPDRSSLKTDTTLLDEERPKLDVWSYMDGRLQPQQLVELKDDAKQAVTFCIDVKTKKVTQINDHPAHTVVVSNKGDGDFALLFDPLPYEVETSWEYPWPRDVYLKNLNSESSTLLLARFIGSVALSPSGKYTYWFDQESGTWWIMDNKSGKKQDVSRFNPSIFVDIEDDHPSKPASYGSGGWAEGEKYLIVNDKTGFWCIDPEGRLPARRVGKKPDGRWAYRVEKWDTELPYHALSKPLRIRAVNHNTKEEKYVNLDWGTWQLTEWSPGPAAGTTPSFFTQSRNGGTPIFRIKSSTDYPDLFTTKQISSVNPQQKDFAWYKVELVHYLNADGDSMMGLLYLPESLDATKKYPMIVYFYERMSDYLHTYQSPKPSYSTISRSFYCSNGYAVFVPDIQYKVGQPGPSAFNCIVPGVLSVLHQYPFIDHGRIGLQGQSWGGYQTAYLITRTDLFACGMAGAPVSNMTSAYGGMRWGSGLHRAFQYEHGQSRIGGTLWEKPLWYLENSPIFYADRVQTPLLIMHNDKDGAVPWYQGIEYFTALRRLEKPVWMLTYNEEDHNLTKLPNRIDLSHRMFGFFNHYLKGEPMPVWMEQGIPAIDKEIKKGY